MKIAPLQVVAIVFYSSTVISAIFLIRNRLISDIIKRYWHLIAIILVASLIARFPFGNKYFDGLEYEDSYIYKTSARFIFLGNYEYSNINPYFPTSCSYGSLERCSIPSIYVTNYLGYPYLISIGYRVFGYHANISNILSYIFSSLSAALLFCCALLVINSLSYALVCSLIYLTIPIFNVYSSTSLTEPLSNYYLLLTVLVALLVMGRKSQGDELPGVYWLGYIALALTLLMAILVRTSNMTFIFCLIIISLVDADVLSRRIDRARTTKLVLFCSVAVAVFFTTLFVFRFDIASIINASDIGMEPYSLRYTKALAPVFTKSLMTIKWYLFYSGFLIVGLLFCKRNRIIGYLSLTYLAYFVLHTVHYRSYYFTRGSEVFSDEFIRYSISIISLYALIAGAGVFYLADYIIRLTRKGRWKAICSSVLILTVIVIVLISYKLTRNERKYLLEDEYNSRMSSVIESLKHIDYETSILIASDHIIYQIYGPPTLRLIELAAIGTEVPMNTIDILIENEAVLYIEKNEADIMDRARYQAQYDYIDSKKREVVYSGTDWNLVRLKTSK